MKLLLVEPFGHENGHFSIYAGYMCRALAEKENDVTLVTFNGMLNSIPDIPRLKHMIVTKEQTFYTLSKRIIFKLINVIPFLRPLTGYFQTRQTLKLAFRLDKVNRYDIIHLLDSGLHSIPLNVAALNVRRKKLALTLHGPLRSEQRKYLRKEFKISLKKLALGNSFSILASLVSNCTFMDLLDKWLYRLVKRRNTIGFVCYTKEMCANYNRNGFYENVSYVPDTRPTPELIEQKEAREKIGLPLDKSIFLSFGINHDRKDYDVIFKATTGLPKNFKLVFAGKILPQQVENDPRQLTTNYGLTQDTIIDDRQIPDSEMLYYFFAADVLLVSYKKGFDQLSGSLLQACQCGLCAIGIDEGHIGDFIRSNSLGLTFKTGNSESLKQAMSTFLKMSNNEKQAMRQNVLRYAATANNWEQMINGYINLYKSLE